MSSPWPLETEPQQPTISGYSVLPGLDRAGLWRVCYNERPGDTPGLEVALTSGSAVQLLATSDPALQKNALSQSTGTTAAVDGVVDEDNNADRLTNASRILSDIREDLANNLPFGDKSGEGCTQDVRSFYSDVWGQNFDDRLQTVRALTLAFALCGALKIISKIFCFGSGGGCGGGGGGGGRCSPLGCLNLIHVLAGWAGWLVFLWIILDIRANTSAHDVAEKSGILIDTAAARRVQSYWGYSFWFFFTSTALTTILACLECCC